MYQYEAIVVRVVDGDTLDLEVNCGFGITKKIRVRLFGIDTPEVYGVKHTSEEYKKGLKASLFAKEWLENIDNKVVINTYKDKKGKYGRYLVEVISPDTNIILNEELVLSGHAISKLYE